MSRKLFGTDGIRGRANTYPMTPDVAMRIGMAVAAHFGRHGRVVVGKDPRRSGYMFETALCAGLCAMGADVLLVGPLPTPAIAHITVSMRADAGVVISASHNAFEDNGIKLFAADGFKLPDEVELELERLAEPGVLDHRMATGDAIGRAVRIDDARGRCITQAKQAFPKELRLDGMRIVLDCANGAAYKLAPTVFAELGATLITTGVSPNGTNINAGVGALYPEHVCELVRQHGADVGLAFDGDADRVVFSDAAGNVVDGDAILAICGIEMARTGELEGGAVVSTIMSNLGLEHALHKHDLRLERTLVGDRYVVERMRAGGYNLGGEQSGHMIFLDHATTGDGIIAGLQVLSVMLRRERPLDELAKILERVPQVLRSVRVAKKVPLAQLPKLSAERTRIEQALAGRGRVVLRYSGTEAKLRVMVEGEHGAKIAEMADQLCETALAEIAAAT